MGQAIGPILNDEDVILAVTADHSTPSAGPLIHSGEPVPLILCGKGVRRDAVMRFDEISAAGGALGHPRGTELLRVLLNAMDRARLEGIRETPVVREFWPAPCALSGCATFPDAIPKIASGRARNVTRGPWRPGGAALELRAGWSAHHAMNRVAHTRRVGQVVAPGQDDGVRGGTGSPAREDGPARSGPPLPARCPWCRWPGPAQRPPPREGPPA